MMIGATDTIDAAMSIWNSVPYCVRNQRMPTASVNFITAHDGYTLNDLVSYEQKHNEANGVPHAVDSPSPP